jgi:GT2 family glycosyltransferase
MKTISIVIPNYNGAQILQENLPIILQHSQKYSAPVIIVDDGSTDDSIQILQDKFKASLFTQANSLDIQAIPSQITIIKKDKNQGFSSTVNIGVKAAKTDLVCLLNSDIIPSQNFLDPLLPYFDDSQVAAVGMMDLSDDGDSHGRGKFIFHQGFILHQKLKTSDELTSGITGWVSCGSGLFSKKIWEEIGGLNEILNPFYFEDVDYGYRAWKSGYKMYFEKKSVVEHVHKKGAIKTHYDEQRIQSISFRNQIIVSWTNITDISLILKHLLFLPTFVIRVWLPKWYINGFKEAIKAAPQVVSRRQFVSKNFKLTDKQVFEIVNK